MTDGTDCAQHVRRAWWIGLGILWVIDGLLQAQPVMFRMDMVNSLMRPNTLGQPDWIVRPVVWSIDLWSRAPAAFNGLVVVLQLVIGVLILTGRDRPLGRLGLLITVLWGLTVWFFGEALGGLLSVGASYVNGAPGAAMLYVLIAVALLLPRRIWRSRRFLSTAGRLVGLLWLAGAALQAMPSLSQRRTLVSLFSMSTGYPNWTFLIRTGDVVAYWAGTRPVLWNGAFVAVMGVIGLSAVLRPERRGRGLLALSLLWLVFVWWFGQGLGGIFSGMATDPNTAPLWALMMLPLWARRSTPTPREAGF